MNSKQLMNRAADNIRILTAAMVEKAKSGHPGGAMGGGVFLHSLPVALVDHHNITGNVGFSHQSIVILVHTSH